MANFYKLIIIICIFPAFVYGQVESGYYSGYAVTNKGDTLKGYLEFRNWEFNPQYALFKSELEGKAVRLTKNEIRSFHIDVGYPVDFQKYEGPVSMDNTDVNTILYERDTSFKIDTVFLRVIRKGNNLILFSYDDKMKARYFIADGPSFQPVELIYRLHYEGISSNGNGGRIVYENGYKNQLFALAAKYGIMDDKLRVDLEKAEYSEQDIAAVVSKINGVSEKDNKIVSHTKGAPKVKLLLMVAAFIVVAYLVLSVSHK